jgi:HAD superfamily hydrolase (TIGR01509 family)
MALRAIIFDVDGTLANTERDGHRPAFNAAFAEVGLPWHWDESFYGTLLVTGGGMERLRFYAEHFDPVTRARPDLDELLHRVHDIKTLNYQRLLAAGAIPLRADIGQLICDARTEGVRLAIASSSKQENVVGLLRANLGPNADSWFDAIASGSVAAAKKPSPDIYLWALKQLNLPARDCLAVEDSAHGLAASLAAGIPTVITVSDYTMNENFDGARMVLHEKDPVSLEKLQLWHATASTS